MPSRAGSDQTPPIRPRSARDRAPSLSALKKENPEGTSARSQVVGARVGRANSNPRRGQRRLVRGCHGIPAPRSWPVPCADAAAKKQIVCPRADAADPEHTGRSPGGRIRRISGEVTPRSPGLPSSGQTITCPRLLPPSPSKELASRSSLHAPHLPDGRVRGASTGGDFVPRDMIPGDTILSSRP